MKLRRPHQTTGLLLFNRPTVCHVCWLIDVQIAVCVLQPGLKCHFWELTDSTLRAVKISSRDSCGDRGEHRCATCIRHRKERLSDTTSKA